MSKRIIAVLVVLTTMALLLISPNANASEGSLIACEQPASTQAQYGNIPCTEIDRAIHEAAIEFKINETRFRLMIRCESRFRPSVKNKESSATGLTQQTIGFRSAQVPEFDHDPYIRVDLGKGMPDYRGPTTAFQVTNPFHNARLAAFVISEEGYGQWMCKGR